MEEVKWLFLSRIRHRCPESLRVQKMFLISFKSHIVREGKETLRICLIYVLMSGASWRELLPPLHSQVQTTHETKKVVESVHIQGNQLTSQGISGGKHSERPLEIN